MGQLIHLLSQEAYEIKAGSERWIYITSFMGIEGMKKDIERLKMNPKYRGHKFTYRKLSGSR